MLLKQSIGDTLCQPTWWQLRLMTTLVVYIFTQVAVGQDSE